MASNAGNDDSDELYHFNNSYLNDLNLIRKQLKLVEIKDEEDADDPVETVHIIPTSTSRRVSENENLYVCDDSYLDRLNGIRRQLNLSEIPHDNDSRRSCGAENRTTVSNLEDYSYQKRKHRRSKEKSKNTKIRDPSIENSEAVDLAYAPPKKKRCAKAEETIPTSLQLTKLDVSGVSKSSYGKEEKKVFIEELRHKIFGDPTKMQHDDDLRTKKLSEKKFIEDKLKNELLADKKRKLFENFPSVIYQTQKTDHKEKYRKGSKTEDIELVPLAKSLEERKENYVPSSTNDQHKSTSFSAEASTSTEKRKSKRKSPKEERKSWKDVFSAASVSSEKRKGLQESKTEQMELIPLEKILSKRKQSVSTRSKDEHYENTFSSSTAGRSSESRNYGTECPKKERKRRTTLFSSESGVNNKVEDNLSFPKIEWKDPPSSSTLSSGPCERKSKYLAIVKRQMLNNEFSDSPASSFRDYICEMAKTEQAYNTDLSSAGTSCSSEKRTHDDNVGLLKQKLKQHPPSSSTATSGSSKFLESPTGKNRGNRNSGSITSSSVERKKGNLESVGADTSESSTSSPSISSSPVDETTYKKSGIHQIFDQPAGDYKILRVPNSAHEEAEPAHIIPKITTIANYDGKNSRDIVKLFESKAMLWNKYRNEDEDTISVLSSNSNVSPTPLAGDDLYPAYLTSASQRLDWNKMECNVDLRNERRISLQNSENSTNFDQGATTKSSLNVMNMVNRRKQVTDYTYYDVGSVTEVSEPRDAESEEEPKKKCGCIPKCFKKKKKHYFK